jgi:ferritin-like metal-binding protein YciE
MEEMKDLRDLLVHELEDLYSAEEQIIEGLPGMIDAAQNKELKKALSDHLKVTKKQKSRLDQIKKALGEEEEAGKGKGFFANLFSGGEGKHHCEAMEGLIKEGEKMMEEDMEPEVMDAAIIASAQKIEHYEIAGYGTAKAYALHLGLKPVASLIDETLNEEYFADDSLTELAIGKVNLDAGGEEEVQGLKKLTGSRNSGNGKTANAGKSTSGRTNAARATSKSSSAGRSKSGANSKTASGNKGRSKSRTAGKSGSQNRSKSKSR